MEGITLPTHIEYIHDTKNPFKATLTVEPCFPGYGVTLGNALRRVLLSSLEGVAVTAFKIKGVHHEFSTLPNVQEDIVELMMNLKRLKFKLFSEESVRLYLSASGEKQVSAKDIEANSLVQIINKDEIIATLTSKNAKFEMELVVEKGRGFLPTEDRANENPEVDLITIDASFNPLRSVGYRIENVRVGQMTTYEKIILDLETDGSLDPEEAVQSAIQILLEHFQIIGGKKQDVFFGDSEETSSEVSFSENETFPKEITKKRAGRPKKN